MEEQILYGIRTKFFTTYQTGNKLNFKLNTFEADVNHQKIIH